VGGVDLNKVESSGDGAEGCLTKGFDYGVDAGLIERLRDGVGGGKGESARCDRLPAAFSGQEKTVTDLRRSHARLSAGVGELNACTGTLGVEKGGDPRERGNVRVFPDA